MLPTVSASSLPAQRRSTKHASAANLHRNRPQVTRSNSIFGALKNIVTAPFAWLATNNEDFAEEKDDQGKRRRVAVERTNTISAHDEGRAPHEGYDNVDEAIARGTKRLRMSSPARHVQHPSSRAGYNDPPESALVANAYVPPHRSASVSVPPTTIRPAADTHTGTRYTRSPMRASSLALQPTMAVDPPAFTQPQPIQRDVSMSAIPSPRDTSMEPKTFTFSQSQAHTAQPLVRDLSLPPSTSRPSFVLRSSLTPQPSQQLLPLISPASIRRDASEPPPISSLRQNPIFVRGPTKNERIHIPSDSVTLGTLVENQRSSRSPSRSHSLLFPSPSQDLTSTNHHAPQTHMTPAQKALHALDVYKTPLVPTRLRASTPSQGPFDVNSLINGSISGSGGPDLFKRRNPLILMNDRERGGRKKKDRDAKKDKKDKSRGVNETKPYAGAGGMKKLLARARAEDAAERRKESTDDDQVDMQLDKEKQKIEVDEGVQTEDNVVPPVPKDDWYTIASQSSQVAGPSSGSSLRVGRTKLSRNHIARPSAPIGRRSNKFSAVYEDDAMDGDEEMKETAVETAANSEEQRRLKELKELEEAAKRAPVFNPPPSFTFAKEGPPPVQPNENAQEPPISSLPFSFAKPVGDTNARNPPAVAVTDSTTLAGPSALSLPPAPPSKSESVPAPATQGLSLNKAPDPAIPSSTVDGNKTDSQGGGGIPNFFASSALLAKPVVPQVTSGLSFAPLASTASSSQPAPPVSVQTIDVKPAFSLAPSFSFIKVDNTQKETSHSIQAPAQDAGKNPFLIPTSSESKDTASARNASIDAPATTSDSTTARPSSTGFFSLGKPADGATAIKQPAFPFGQATATSTTSADSAPAPPLFGGSTLFTSSSTGTKSDATAKTSSFPASTAETPKPLFNNASSTTSGGTSSLFNFGASADSKTAASAMTPSFSFSSSPSSPAISEEKKPAFSFNATPSATPVSSGFSFGGGGSAGSDVSNKPFSFIGSTPARPSTPPRPTNDEQEMRMEESPTREAQQPNRDLPKPTLQFSFNSGATSGSTLFGSAAPSGTSTPFSFSAPSTSATSVFGKPAEAAAKPADALKPFSFSQPSSTAASSFSFSQPANDSSRPTSGGAFSFGTGSTPTSATAATPFNFGASVSTTPVANPFGSVNSAPSSPSTFSTAPAFTFGAGAGGQVATPTSATSNTPFTFGTSQPASPAAAASALPAAGGFGNAQPAPSFGAPAGGAAGSPGSLFTIGAAPAAPPGGRQIKKLPMRRGGKR